MTDEEKQFEALLSQSSHYKPERVTHTDTSLVYRDATITRRKWSNGKVRYFWFGLPSFSNHGGYANKAQLYQSIKRHLRHRLYECYKAGLFQ